MPCRRKGTPQRKSFFVTPRWYLGIHIFSTKPLSPSLLRLCYQQPVSQMATWNGVVGKGRVLMWRARSTMCGHCPSQQVLQKPPQPCPGTAHTADRACREAHFSRCLVNERESCGQPFLPCMKCFLRNKHFFSIWVLHLNIKREMILWLSLVFVFQQHRGKKSFLTKIPCTGLHHIF